LASGDWGLRPQTSALLLPLTDIDLSERVSSVKNNTEVTNSKCYAFASSALLRRFFTLNNMINIWPHLKFSSPPLPSTQLRWAGYGPERNSVNSSQNISFWTLTLVIFSYAFCQYPRFICMNEIGDKNRQISGPKISNFNFAAQSNS